MVPLTDSTPPPHPADGAGSEALEASAAVVAALEAVHGLLERAAIYPGGHPAVDRAASRAAGRLADAWAAEDPILLEVRGGELRANGLPAGSARCSELARDLLELDVIGLELASGLPPEELVAFAAEIAAVRAAGGSRAARQKWQTDAGPLHVSLLDYAALRFDDGVQTDADPERIWNALHGTILPHPDSPPAVTPEELAEQLARDLQGTGADAANVLGGQLQRLLDDIQELPQDSRRDARARVGELMVALPRELRDDLLRIESRFDLADGDPESPMRPESLVTTLLFHAVQSSARPPEDAVALMNQLLRTSSIDPEHKLDLSELIPDGEGPLAPEQLEQLGEMIHEVFLKREDIQANPRDYQELIDLLASAGVAEHVDLAELTRRYRNPACPVDVLGHAVEIAALQFAGPEPEKWDGGVVAFLARATEPLLGEGRVAPFGAAVRAVHAYSLTQAPDADEETVAAMTDYLRHSLSEDTVRRVVVALSPNDAPPPDVLDYLRTAGVAGLDPMLEALAGEPGPAANAALLGALLELPPDRLLGAIRERASRGWNALRPVFPLLARIGGPRSQQLLETLLNHENERVRTRALSALTSGSLDGDRLEELLYPLLRDRSPRLVRAALRKLGELPGQGSVDLLGSFVRGRLAPPGAEASVELRLLAVRVLTLKGAPGWRCLGQCLSRVSWRLNRSDIQTARAIAETVRSRYEGSAAAGMLRAWTVSPARWIGPLIVRGGKTKVNL